MSIYEQTTDTSHNIHESDGGNSAFVRPEKGRSKNSSSVILFSSESQMPPSDIVEEIIYTDVEVILPEDEPSPHLQGTAFLKSKSRSKKKRVLPICLTVAIFVILVGSMFFALDALAPRATVTLVPARKDLQSTQNIVAVTGIPQGTEVQASTINATENSNPLSVNATGSQSIPAVAAKGMITLSNNAPYAQTIVPGPGTIVTGSDGVQIQLDGVVTIPKATPPNVNGVVQVPAHAVMAGGHGNIPSGDINTPCCTANVEALNETAFSGGVDARPYHVVTQGDVDSAVSTLKESLTQHVQAALTAKLHTGEQLGLVTSCSQRSHSQPSVGEQTDNVSVSLTMSCTGIAYNQNAVRKQAIVLMLDNVARHLPSYALLQSSLHISFEPAVPVAGNSNALSVSVHTQGTWIYQVNMRSLQKLVMGKSVQNVRALLSQNREVQHFDLVLNVPIRTPWWNASVLPVTPDRIQVLIQSN